MKNIITFTLLLLSLLPMMGQQKAPEGFTLIEEQPEGELRIYARTGSIVKEMIYEDDSHEIVTDTQTGTVNIVFADDGSVYIQQPVSESYYDGWIKGTLSADGKSFVVPTGQYTAYTRSFDMAVQVWIMNYDAEQDTYVADQTVTEIVYTIADDGSIALQGTDQQHVLGCVNRCFGDTFSYLDFEWHNNGSDYETVYVPTDIEIIAPPAGLQTQTFIVTTGINDGAQWDAYESTVQLGFDGDDAWLQGFTDLLPKAWVKGRRDGNTVTFPTGQQLGSYLGYMFYMVGAKADDNGEPVVTDIVFTYDGNGTYTSYTDAFVSSAKDDIAYIIYYMGMTLSDKPEQAVAEPEDLLTDDYLMDYQEPNNNGRLIQKEANVWAGLHEASSTVYIQGISPQLPEAYIAGTLTGEGKVVFASPQFLGTYDDEEMGKFPLYFQAFKGDDGTLLPEVSFHFDRETHVLDAPSSAISIGINKTGLLTLQYIYNATFVPASMAAVSSPKAEPSTAKGRIFDLQGRPMGTGSPQKGLYIQNGKKVIVR
jgi:hypothetical protein